MARVETHNNKKFAPLLHGGLGKCGKIDNWLLQRILPFAIDPEIETC